ncbi:MAG: hypothetical protein L6V81_04695 [Clostridium sp.]|nr:MAG: hypothetical protein L6V81_04695 [Clostridium sp.]
MNIEGKSEISNIYGIFNVIEAEDNRTIMEKNNEDGTSVIFEFIKYGGEKVMKKRKIFFLLSLVCLFLLVLTKVAISNTYSKTAEYANKYIEIYRDNQKVYRKKW